jgi:hypothetical protein
MKRIENAASFLQRTGLLAEINRVVLHPRGLALKVLAVEREVVGFGGLQDARTDPEGMIFEDSDLAESAEQLRLAEADGTASVRPDRHRILGFIVQPLPKPFGMVQPPKPWPRSR